ncbi:glycosyltransferase family 4 protein [Streptococcus suis]|uniref:glycosyltransferase family 4 protein n=1 Tax=Streptococcus suis TaxID=1307 RepID=UPI001C963682|nr:glycosyltransferase family 4 protein [Streptococcus suis]MBY5014095.1 glycosyltransferase family 4 protein [Streptococcus suis]
MRLNYVCQWDLNKERTWSGTTWSLYKALGKKCNINEYDIRYTTLEKILMRLSKVSFSYNGVGRRNQFNAIIDRINQRKLRELDTSFPNLQIGCIGRAENSYIYEDLSVSALEMIYLNHSKAFEKSNFSNASFQSIQEKVKRQNEVYRHSKAIFTMSHWVAEEIKKSAGIDNVYCVGGGINLDKKDIDPSLKAGNKFLFVGRDFYRKGGDLVVKSFVKLHKKYPNLELYIAGTQNVYGTEFENIHWLGELNKIQLVEYFNKCDVFCLPSEFEAYGLVFGEALCFGLPCIGRKICEMPYFIEDGVNGYLIDDNDCDIFSELMERAIFNEEMKKFVRDEKDKYINKYSWDSVVDRLLSYIEEGE